jgi:hypothetical protein
MAHIFVESLEVPHLPSQDWGMDDKFEPPPGSFYVPAPDPTRGQSAAWLNKKALSDRESTLYNIGAIACAALVSAGPGIYDNHPFIGGSFVVVGLGGLLGLGLLLIWYRVKVTHAIIAALMTFCLILSYLVLTRPKEVITYEPPTAEDIEKATSPIRQQLDAKTQELASVTADRNSEKQRADKLDLAVTAAKNETVEARRANGDPIEVTLLPTHLRLQFNSIDQTPVEIDVANIHWSALSYTQKASWYCPNPQIPTFCMLFPPKGDKNDFDQKMIQLTIFFDRSIKYKSVSVDVFGANVGHGVVSNTDRMATIQLRPENSVSSFALDVKAVP